MNLFLTVLLALLAPLCNQLSTAGKPNIIVVLGDDLGIGDVSCYNPASKIPTPHFDALATVTGHAVMVGDDPLKLVVKNTSPPGGRYGLCLYEMKLLGPNDPKAK